MAIRVVVAPDKFKECLSAPAVCEAIARGVRAADPTALIDLIPMADGGDGTVHALVDASGGRIEFVPASGPMGEPLLAPLGLLDDGATAAIEMAAVAGLALVPTERRNPALATTAGVGDLIRECLDRGIRKIVVGIGGSATNDGGAGMAQRLGFQLLDEAGNDLPPGGGALAALDRIDATGVDPRLDQVDIVAACDVTNPLCGPSGAAAVYGPQKGADPAMVRLLDAGLGRLASVLKRDLGVDVLELPGGGAAGGLGAGLVAFCNARLQSGLELVGAVVGLDQRLALADLVLTGEGRYDASSRSGKTAFGVARKAAQLGKPAVVFAGAIGDNIALDEADPEVVVISPKGSSTADAMRNAADNLTTATERIVRRHLDRKVAAGR